MGYKEYFLERAKQKYNDKYDYSLVEYKNAKTKVKIKCNKCGNIFEKTPDKHLNGQECQCYSKVHKLTKEEFIEKSKIIHNDKYDYSLVEYKNAKTKVKIKCPIHGVFEQIPDNHLNKKCGCGLCLNKTENYIQEVLEEKGLVFQKDFFRQKTFEDLKSKKGKKLKFDYFIPKLNLLIEYNGYQHYVFPNHLHKTEKDFLESKERDELKKEYSLKHNYNFLEIPYWEKDVVGFLINKINI